MKTETEINSWSSLACTLGTTDRTLRSWRKLKGSPRGCRQVEEWRSFITQHGLGNRTKSARDPVLEELKAEKLAAQTRVIKLQEERLKIRNAVARGEAIPLDDARGKFALCWKPMIQHLRGTKHRMGMAVVGLPSSGAAKVIAKDLQESADLFAVPQHLKRDPFWREIDKDVQKIKKKSGKI